MKFIILTSKYDGIRRVYVNPSQICFLGVTEKESTLIQFSGAEQNYIEVVESPESVLRLCEEVTE